MKPIVSLFLFVLVATCPALAKSPIFDADATLVLVPNAAASPSTPVWQHVVAAKAYDAICDLMVASTGEYRYQHSYLLADQPAIVESITESRALITAEGGALKLTTQEVGFSVQVKISGTSVLVTGFVAQPSADHSSPVRRDFTEKFPLVEGGAAILHGLTFESGSGRVEAVLYLKLSRHGTVMLSQE